MKRFLPLLTFFTITLSFPFFATEKEPTRRKPSISVEQLANIRRMLASKNPQVKAAALSLLVKIAALGNLEEESPKNSSPSSEQQSK